MTYGRKNKRHTHRQKRQKNNNPSPPGVRILLWLGIVIVGGYGLFRGAIYALSSPQRPCRVADQQRLDKELNDFFATYRDPLPSIAIPHIETPPTMPVTKMFSCDSPNRAATEQYMRDRHAAMVQKINDHNASLDPSRRYEDGILIEYDIDTMIDQMSIRDKVGQLFVVGVNGSKITTEERQFLTDYHPGGVIIMGSNISADTSLSGFVRDMHGTADWIPLIVSIDQEGGPVWRIDESTVGPTGLVGQTAITSGNLTSTYQSRTQLLADHGINLNFGLVADIHEDNNAFIATRTFGGADDLSRVMQAVSSAITATTGVMDTLKHFPGHGAIIADTHQGVARIRVDEQRRRDIHLPPFVSGINAGADVIMLGHLIVPRLDDTRPATLSDRYDALIRDELGFGGIVITDDMAMISASYELETLVRHVLLSSADMLLYVPADETRAAMLDLAIQLVEDGTIPTEVIDTKLRHILTKKQQIIAGHKNYVPRSIITQPALQTDIST